MLNEPDADSGSWHFYQWRLLRMKNSGAWCGYVLIPEGHPWHGLDTWALADVSIHGGVTFAGHHPAFDSYAVGFDCCHSGDILPNASPDANLLNAMTVFTDLAQGVELGSGSTYKTIAYARDEVKLLCEQAGAARKADSDAAS